MDRLKIGVMALVEQARAEIDEITAEEAVNLADDKRCLVVDVRDIRERQRDGFIPGSFHCPRGMVEFWVDPDSFDLFREIRKTLWEQRYEVGWKPVREESALRYCSGDAQSGRINPQ